MWTPFEWQNFVMDDDQERLSCLVSSSPELKNNFVKIYHKSSTFTSLGFSGGKIGSGVKYTPDFIPRFSTMKASSSLICLKLTLRNIYEKKGKHIL